MTKKGSLRRSWPRGLRVLFWASSVGLAIEAAQFYLFGIVEGGLGPPPSLQGMSALVGLALGIVIVATGFWARRRAFVLVAYAKGVLWLFVTCGFFVSMLEEGFAFGFSPARVAEQMPYLAWNLVVVTIAVVVLWYLVSSQLIVTDEDPRSEVSSLPPPVAVDLVPRPKTGD